MKHKQPLDKSGDIEIRTNKQLVIVLLVTLAGCTVGASLKADKIPRLTPGEFVILPWDGPWWWYGSQSDPETLKTIYDCGFNLAGFVTAEALDNLADVSLKGFVFDDSSHVFGATAQLDMAEIEQRAEKIVDRVGEHEALFGYYLRDEPGAKTYPALGKWVDAFRKADPHHRAYINLFPNYASPAQMNVATYQQYIDSYIATVRPDFISYDHYALMDDGSLRDSYFQNLEIVRKAALQNNIPFWNIVNSVGASGYAEPTSAGLRFQLYTTLAYGAGGIAYYTYFTPKLGNYRQGPIDQYGNKTPTWNMLHNVNMQMHRIGPVYITLKSVNVFHLNVPKGCSGIETSLFVKSIQGGDLMVGEFEDANGHPFIMVVNKDLKRSVHFDVVFKNSGQIKYVNAYTGQVDLFGPAEKWLAPGQGILLTLSN